MQGFNKTVHPFDFENISGIEFERLVFAFLCRRWSWDSIDWRGQVGGDEGRDIVGVRDDENGERMLVVVACANRQALTARKALGDLDKIAASQTRPSRILIVAGGSVSADLKGKIADHAKGLRLGRVDVWSGAEFEEHLRAYADSVAARFFRGEELPDEAQDLRAFAANAPTDEQEALRLVARLFDRPAFRTPFQEESSFRAFGQALANTIEALNTGLHRTRDGVLIARIPSKNDFANGSVRAVLDAATTRIAQLRARFEELHREGQIRRCSCDIPDCPVMFVAEPAAEELNRLRFELLDELRAAVPAIEIDPHLYRTR